MQPNVEIYKNDGASKQLPHPTYRKDIDGLRAIAVLSVVGFHAFPNTFKGGFIGVDIFFVISGFLISSIIFSSLESNVFSFVEFYSRRIRRIFPALLVVIIACFTMGWAVLLSDEYKQLGKHLVGVAGFVSNFVLWQESGYFDNATATKLMLHMWSLGIEEQFYILWPLLLWRAWKSRLNLLSVTIALALASFAYNIVKYRSDAIADFYSPQTRFWELLVGSILAYTMLHNTAFFKALKNWLSALLGKMFSANSPGAVAMALKDVQSIAGAIFIAAGILVLNKNHHFPGFWAVLPVVGTALIIGAGAHAIINLRVLSNRFLIWIGLISYPLYLWHWPLLSFARIIEGETPTLTVRIGAVLISVLLAWFTYKLIEKPFRFGAWTKAKILVLVILYFGIVLVGLQAWRGFSRPYSSTQGIEKIQKAIGEWTFPEANFQQEHFNGADFSIRKSNIQRKTVYFGDSEIQQYSARIDELVSTKPNETRSAVFATASGCPPIRNVEREGFPYCKIAIPAGIEYAKRTDVDSIVISALWFSYFKHPDYVYKKNGYSGSIGEDVKAAEYAYEEVEKLISELTGLGKKVYLVLNSPYGKGIDPKNMVKRSFAGFGFSINPGGISKTELLQEYGDIHERLKKIGIRSGAIVIDPLDYLCENGTCPALTEDSEPIYMDASHLRPSFVRNQLKYLDETLLMPQLSVVAN